MDRHSVFSSLLNCRYEALAWLRSLSRWRIRTENFLAKRRRATAVVASLVVHGLLIAALFTGISSTIAGGGIGGTHSGAGTGNEFGVELVAARPASSDALQVKQPDPADAVQPNDLMPTDVTSATSPLAAPISPTIIPISETAARISTFANDTGEQAAGGSGATNALWKQIEPCWHRLATKSTHTANLQVSFSPLGNISRIADGPAAVDSNSQAQAIQAMSECGPYVSASSKEDIVITFPAP